MHLTSHSTEVLMCNYICTRSLNILITATSSRFHSAIVSKPDADPLLLSLFSTCSKLLS